MTAAVVQVGDCRDVLATLADCSVDSVVTDPPYDLTDTGRSFQGQGGTFRPDGGIRSERRTKGFMGKDWDGTGIAFCVDLWLAILRVLKPGGHLLAFGGTRTYHRMVCAIEDAGFEIRDSIHWVYGQGFPKGKDFAKDEEASRIAGQRIVKPEFIGTQFESGWNVALKPAHEPIVLARKPLAAPSVAANVAAHGTGALNIAATRVGNGLVEQGRGGREARETGIYGRYEGQDEQQYAAGRWPPNLLLSHSAACRRVGVKRVRSNGAHPKIRNDTPNIAMSGRNYARELPARIEMADATGHETVEHWACAPGCPVRVLDEQAGVRTSGERNGKHIPNWNDGEKVTYRGNDTGNHFEASSGNASRYFPTFRPDPSPMFYCAKASRADRTSNGQVVNGHPTCKPTKLIRWLCRLITPPGGTVLDPFMGSGTTAIACLDEGFQFIGIEKELEYVRIAEERIAIAEAVPLLIPRSPSTLPVSDNGDTTQPDYQVHDSDYSDKE